MKIWIDEISQFIDADPEKAALGMMSAAHVMPPGQEKSDLAHLATEILIAHATACPGCGAYDGQPHPSWCRGTGTGTKP